MDISSSINWNVPFNGIWTFGSRHPRTSDVCNLERLSLNKMMIVFLSFYGFVSFATHNIDLSQDPPFQARPRDKVDAMWLNSWTAECWNLATHVDMWEISRITAQLHITVGVMFRTERSFWAESFSFWSTYGEAAYGQI